MTNTTISITRALAEIKNAENRIKSLQAQPMIARAVDGRVVNGHRTLADTEVQLKANLQAAKDLLKRRALLKGKVIASNAVTPVVVAGVQTTVAQAIEQKVSVQLQLGLLEQMRSQLAHNVRLTEEANVNMRARTDALMQTIVGKDRKATDEECQAVLAPFIKQNETKLVDPNNLEKEIDKMRGELQNFIEDVDYSLSEVNAKTTIEV